MPTKNFRHVRRSTTVKKPDGGRIKVGGYRPDKKNPHDKTYQASQLSSDSLPPKVDLRSFMSPVENQENSNSCTANAMAGAYEYLANRLKGYSDDFSRLFIYYNARELDGDTSLDEGTYLRSCIKVLQKYGTCSEQTWPFELHQIFEPPHDTAYEEAANFLIEDAYRVEVDLDTMRSCLAEGYPFAFGLTLFSSFQKAGANGLVPMPDPENEQHDGGHAMLCVGYSDVDQVFIVRNSWSDEWGDRGYCYIPYDYMTDPNLNGDLWAVRQVSDLDIDLSEGIEGDLTSLFDETTAALVNAIRLPGSGDAIASDDYTVEYEDQSVYVDGQGFVAVGAYAGLEALYYQAYEAVYEDYAAVEESTEESEESDEEEYEEETEEDSEEDYEEEEESAEEYEEDAEEDYEEESEDSDEDDYEEETEEEYEEETEEDDYEEDAEAGNEESYEDE
jgi:C1A family cysteine protease